MAQVEYTKVSAHVGPIALQLAVVPLPLVIVFVQKLRKNSSVEFRRLAIRVKPSTGDVKNIASQCVPGFVLGSVLMTNLHGICRSFGEVGRSETLRKNFLLVFGSCSNASAI